MTLGLGILTIPIPLEYLNGAIILISTVPAAVGMFGWMYAIGIGLQRRLPESLQSPQTTFRIHFAYVFFCIALIGLIMLFREELNRNQSLSAVVVLLILYYFVAAFVVMRFAAKSLASLELQRIAAAADYAGYMMLMWLFPVGVWFIQPKLNRIVDQNVTAA